MSQAVIEKTIKNIIEYENEFDQLNDRVRNYISPSELDEYDQSLELKDSEKLEIVKSLKEEIIQEIGSSAIDDSQTDSKITEPLEELEEIIGIATQISSEKQEELVPKIELAKSEIIYVTYGLVQEKLNKPVTLTKDQDPNRRKIYQELRDYRNKLEKEQRRTNLLNPPNQQDFKATLMWMSQRGEAEDLILLKKIQKKSPYSYDIEGLESLLSSVINKIEERLERQGTELGQYRVFCSEENSKNLPIYVEIIRAYPAFTMIRSSEATATELKSSYHIECISSQKDPKKQSNSSMFLKSQDFISLKEREIPMRDQIVQFNAPVVESWKRNLEEIGAKILQPLGGSQFVVSVPDENAINQIRGLEEVAQVTPYVPQIRVQAQTLRNLGQTATPEAIKTARLRVAQNPPNSSDRSIALPGILIANFFTPEDREQAGQNLESQGIAVIDRPGKTKLVIDLSADRQAIESLKIITEQVGLESLGEKTIPKLFNDVARHLIGKGVIPSNPIPNNLNLTGKNEIIAIADSGLDTGDPDTLHLDFQGRVRQIISYPLQPSLTPLVLNPGDDDGASDQYSGHGTHVAGSAVGSGEQARALGLSERPAGMAPEAELIFQAIEQTPRWNEQGKLYWLENYGEMPPNSGLFGIPDDISLLFAEAYANGARIHSNSWGGGSAGIYDEQCQDLDRFVWEHKDFLVLVAAGNSGKHSSSATPGIDPTSVDSPGTAKNCLTVGASENSRAEQFADTYGNWWPDKFPYSPFKTEGIANSADHIVAFSSRGPCLDDRRKPDVVAPGTFILSTRSSQIPRNNFAWGVYPPAKKHYMYMGGTSMATPLVAGCAALVRQYLRENCEINNPSAALVKATLIHAAEYLPYDFAHPNSSPWADDEQGWGRINLKRVLNVTAPARVHFVDDTQGLVTGDQREYEVEITDHSVPLKATLVYTDYPGRVVDINDLSLKELVNNLNLILYSPSGQSYFGNDFTGTGASDSVNNVEGMIIESPEAGIWKIVVVAFEVQMESQDYALVISGAFDRVNSGTRT